MINIRLATPADTDAVEAIMEDAIKFLGIQGLPQWQGGYGPDRQWLEDDARLGYGYVLEVDGEVHGYAAMEPGIDNDYEALKNGTWEGRGGGYIVIHRVMIGEDMRGRGMGSKFLRMLVDEARRLRYGDIRIDTHPGNVIMKKAIAEAGFVYRGDLILDIPHGERAAYQLLL